MGKTGVLGSFEELVLLAVLQVGPGAFSVSIRRELQKRTGADVAMGAVYATLDRLEGKELLESELEARSGNVGRPRRVYRLRPEARTALDESRRIREAMWRGLGPLAEAEGA